MPLSMGYLPGKARDCVKVLLIFTLVEVLSLLVAGLVGGQLSPFTRQDVERELSPCLQVRASWTVLGRWKVVAER